MTPEEIAELRRLLSAATKGPWTHHGYEPKPFHQPISGPDWAEFALVVTEVNGRLSKTGHANAALIVAMRNKLAGMLDEIERLQNENADNCNLLLSEIERLKAGGAK